MRTRWLAAVAVAAVIATLAIAWPDDATGVACPASARPATLHFTLKDVNGIDVNLADYKGKVLLLDFWATWCGPCKVEIPAFMRLRERYRAQGFEVASVIIQDDFANAGPFSAKLEMNYPVLNGTERDDLIDAFGPFAGLPTSFLINRDGLVCKRHLGLPQVDMSQGPLEEAVEKFFDAEIRALL
jgi:cytochrome c biogenesis protein CcmG/thiol:disulfide interchange protein DsbE